MTAPNYKNIIIKDDNTSISIKNWKIKVKIRVKILLLLKNNLIVVYDLRIYNIINTRVLRTWTDLKQNWLLLFLITGRKQ